jgi:hypothetical protein
LSAPQEPGRAEHRQRNPERWARIDPNKKVSDGGKINPNRYEAINLQNRHTVEFRLFKGTLKRESFFRSLEFVDALVHFCMPANNGIADCIGLDKFFAHVDKNKKQYPNLHTFVNQWRTATEPKEGDS